MCVCLKKQTELWCDEWRDDYLTVFFFFFYFSCPTGGSHVLILPLQLIL